MVAKMYCWATLVALLATSHNVRAARPFTDYVNMFIGTASTMLLLPPASVIRADGSLVKVQKASSPHEEIVSFLSLFKDWRMLGTSLVLSHFSS